MSALGDVLPRPASKNTAHGRWCDAKGSSQEIAVLTKRSAAADFENYIGSQFSVAVLFAACKSLREYPGRVAIPSGGTALGNHIGAVVGMCTEEEVRRIDTASVVAIGAVMQDEQPIGDSTVGKFPRDAMGNVPHGTAPHQTVAIGAAGACPQPARIGAILARGLGPEPQVCSLAIVGKHAGTRTKVEQPQMRRKAKKVFLALGASDFGFATLGRHYLNLLTRFGDAVLRAVAAAPGLSAASNYTIGRG